MSFKLIALFSLVLISVVFGQPNWGNNGWNNNQQNGQWTNNGPDGANPNWNQNGPNQWNQGRRNSWGDSPEERMAKMVFDQSRWGGPAVAECPRDNIGFIRKTWTAGGTRPYYKNLGYLPDFEQCVQLCAQKDDCYFVTYTSNQNCYALTTSDSDMCQYMNHGHFGQIGESCSGFKPCPSAYKTCTNPSCSLWSIAQVYCKNNDQIQAVNTCNSNLP